MDTGKNDKLIQKLRSTSPSVVYQTLVEIRTKEVNSANGVALLRKKGALKYFVKLLQKPNDKILDITLSILGNCCLENETRLELWRLGAIGPIVRILEGVGKDSIQGRTCRVLANLAQIPEVAAIICKEGAVPAIVAILGIANENNVNDSNSSSISESTKQMAVRALRVLAVSPEYRMEILNQGGVRAVAELLSSNNEELQKAAIKALVTLTQHCSEECAIQVQGDGACFERLVSFVWDPSLVDESSSKKPSSSLSQGALTCLTNLARVPEVRPRLGNAGAITAVVNQLRHASTLDFSEEWKLNDLVSTLCLFCRESVNRMKLRDYGGLSQLLIHLKDDKHGPVAAALCHFAYDEHGFRQLVECGLIQICADRLRDVISAKLKENGRCHTFVPLKKEHLPKKIQNRRSSVRVQKPELECRGVYRQVSIDDCTQNALSGSQEQKVYGYLEENNKKLLKSPLKMPNQKTFRISSPSYQAVRQEQEGLIQCSLTCSSPPSAVNSSSLFNNTIWNGSNCGIDCSQVGSSLGGSSLWPGSNNSFSLSGFFQNHSPVSPMPLSFSASQFQEGPLSPETSSCCSGSGGSSSSYTSGYASSPHSDLSDAPSPSSGYSTATTNDSGEVYSPVYEDGSDESCEGDLETKCNEEKEKDGRIPCSKRSRKETNLCNKDLNELKTKKKCSSLLGDKTQETSTCNLLFKEEFFKATTDGCKSDLGSNLQDEGCEERMDEDEKEQQGSTEEENEKGKNENSLVGYLLVLLSCASQLEDPIEELASHNTFSALLDYHLVNQDPAPRATRVLTRIVRNEHYLIPLINQRFVMLVRSCFCLPFEHRVKQQCKAKSKRVSLGKDMLSQWKQCSECIRLKSLGMSLLMDLATSAESGFGEGELAYGLLKGDGAHRMSIALSLPFIIRVKKILRKLLLGCNGFMILLEILRDYGNIGGNSNTMIINKEKDGEESILMLNAAVDGLSYLAHVVGVTLTKKINASNITEKSPQCIDKQEKITVDQQHLEIMQNGYLNDSNDKVIFSLDDGSLVNASRDGLSNISPVFRAMLQGDFLESKEGNSIKLPGVSHFCLNYILHHLGECTDINCINLKAGIKHSVDTSSEPSPATFGSCHWAKKPSEVYSALELVSIADRFLLPDAFRKKLADQVLDWYLCPDSAAKIYMWCIGSDGINGSRAPEGLGLLEGTIKYILVGDMALSERVTLMKSVFDVGLGKELLSDMNDIIRMFIES